MKRFVGLLSVMLCLSGCGTAIQPQIHSQPQMNFPLGTVLGWNNHLYKIVKTTSPSDHGKKLGHIAYHGKVVSGLITVFEIQGKSPSKTIVFESSTGQYFLADVQTKNSH